MKTSRKLFSPSALFSPPFYACVNCIQQNTEDTWAPSCRRLIHSQIVSSFHCKWSIFFPRYHNLASAASHGDNDGVEESCRDPPEPPEDQTNISSPLVPPIFASTISRKFGKWLLTCCTCRSIDRERTCRVQVLLNVMEDTSLLLLPHRLSQSHLH